jgi:hypothetical protein
MKHSTTTKKNSALGVGCMILFGLPFFAAGAFIIIQGIKKFSSSAKEGLVLMGFGGVFACVGLGVMLMGIFSGKMGKKQSALEQRHPDEPWLWRDAWKNGIVKSSSAAGVAGIAFFALFWNAISWVMVFVVPWQKELAKNKAVLLALLFPLIGIGLAIAFVYALLRSMKYGNSILNLDTFPGVIGGQFKATVNVPAEVYPDHGFKVRLVNVQQYESGSGKNRRTSERTLWEDERTVKDFKRRNRGTDIPVAFTIPSSSKATTLGSPGHDVIWRISISADTPGIDYASSFNIPVFVTEDSADDIEPDEMTVDVDGASSGSERKEAQPFKTVCRELKIEHKHPGRGRMALEFKAGRNKRSACGLFFFFLIWTGVVVALFMNGAPFLLGLVFGFFDVIIFAILMSMLFSSAKIEINSRGIQVTKKFMGFGGTKSMSIENLESIKPTSSMQSNDKHYYVLELKGKDGQELTAGGMILGKHNAKRVIAEIMEVVREGGG